jgi:hypothetical protein
VKTPREHTAYTDDELNLPVCECSCHVTYDVHNPTALYRRTLT